MSDYIKTIRKSACYARGSYTRKRARARDKQNIRKMLKKI